MGRLSAAAEPRAAAAVGLTRPVIGLIEVPLVDEETVGGEPVA